MSQDPQKNMAVIRHWLNTICEDDISMIVQEIREILTDDYILHDPAYPDLKPGAANFIELIEQLVVETAQRKVTVEDMFAMEDKVVTRFTYEFLDVKTKSHKKMAVMVISHFEGGKIKAEWEMIAPVDAPPA